MRTITLLIALFIGSMVSAQTSYITTTGDIVFEASALEKFDAPTIFVSGCYNPRQETWIVTLGLSTGVVSATSPIKKEVTIIFTKAEIDAFTGSGTGDTAKLQNALDQAVKDLIETLNVSSTVTIH